MAIPDMDPNDWYTSHWLWRAAGKASLGPALWVGFVAIVALVAVAALLSLTLL